MPLGSNLENAELFILYSFVLCFVDIFALSGTELFYDQLFKGALSRYLATEDQVFSHQLNFKTNDLVSLLKTI